MTATEPRCAKCDADVTQPRWWVLPPVPLPGQAEPVHAVMLFCGRCGCALGVVQGAAAGGSGGPIAP